MRLERRRGEGEDLQGAEPEAEVAVLVEREVLLPEEDHLALEQHGVHRLDLLVGLRHAQVGAVDDRADGDAEVLQPPAVGVAARRQRGRELQRAGGVDAAELGHYAARWAAARLDEIRDDRLLRLSAHARRKGLAPIRPHRLHLGRALLAHLPDVQKSSPSSSVWAWREHGQTDLDLEVAVALRLLR